MLGNMSKTEESLRKLEKVRERQEARVETRPVKWYTMERGFFRFCVLTPFSV